MNWITPKTWNELNIAASMEAMIEVDGMRVELVNEVWRYAADKDKVGMSRFTLKISNWRYKMKPERIGLTPPPPMCFDNKEKE